MYIDWKCMLLLKISISLHSIISGEIMAKSIHWVWCPRTVTIWELHLHVGWGSERVLPRGVPGISRVLSIWSLNDSSGGRNSFKSWLYVLEPGLIVFSPTSGIFASKIQESINVLAVTMGGDTGSFDSAFEGFVIFNFGTGRSCRVILWYVEPNTTASWIIWPDL